MINARGRCARVCVELDLHKRLKPGITVFEKRRSVEYEGLHLVCFKCGKYGHHRDVCSEYGQSVEGVQSQGMNTSIGSLNKLDTTGRDGKCSDDSSLQHNDQITENQKRQWNKTVQSKEAKGEGVTVADDGEHDYGPWMLVKRPLQRKAISLDSQGMKSKISDSQGLKSKTPNTQRMTTKLVEKKGVSRVDLNHARKEGVVFKENASGDSKNIGERRLEGKKKDTSERDLRSFGRDVTNHSEWVPMGPKKQVTNGGLKLGQDIGAKKN